MKILQFLERVWWVFALSFVGALSAPQVASLLGGDWTLSALDAAWVAGTTAVLREVVAFGQARISVLPNPGGVPTPLTAAIRREPRAGSGADVL